MDSKNSVRLSLDAKSKQLVEIGMQSKVSQVGWYVEAQEDLPSMDKESVGK